VIRHARRAAALVAAVLVGLPGTLATAAVTLAASPDATSASVGDPRSAGQGPGLVGDPGLAIVLVALIALASILITVAYLRLTAGSGGTNGGRGPG